MIVVAFICGIVGALMVSFWAGCKVSAIAWCDLLKDAERDGKVMWRR